MTLTVSQLSVELDKKHILRDFSLTVEKGEILCLLGPSGCGKTTALKAIAGLIKCSAGEIELFEETLLNGRHVCPPEKRGMGFIFQDYALFPHMTVEQNIAFALHGQPKELIHKTVQEVLSLVHMQGLEGRYPHQLSGGQQQRTAVARALANKPKLLLMDEPFSNIDSQVKHKLMAELRTLLKGHGITCIFVTHAKYEAFSFADKTAVIHNGRIEQVGCTQSVYEQPLTQFVARFMESGNVLPHGTLPLELFNQPLPDHAQTGHWLLKESGFKLHDEAGVQGTILDSVYMGNRYRHTVLWGEHQLTMESPRPLEQGKPVHFQYDIAPIWINEPIHS